MDDDEKLEAARKLRNMTWWFAIPFALFWLAVLAIGVHAVAGGERVDDGVLHRLLSAASYFPGGALLFAEVETGARLCARPGARLRTCIAGLWRDLRWATRSEEQESCHADEYG